MRREPALRLIEGRAPENADHERRRHFALNGKFVEREREPIELAQARDHPVCRFVGQNQNAPERGRFSVHAGTLASNERR